MKKVTYCNRKLSAKLKIVYEESVGHKIKPQTWRKKLCHMRKNTDYSIDSNEFTQQIWAEGKRIKWQKEIGDRPLKAYDLIKLVGINVKGFNEKKTAKQFTFWICDYLKIAPPQSTKYWFFKKLGASSILNDETRFLIALKVYSWKIEKEIKDVKSKSKNSIIRIAS